MPCEIAGFPGPVREFGWAAVSVQVSAVTSCERVVGPSSFKFP